jgi:hypothetical protein
MDSLQASNDIIAVHSGSEFEFVQNTTHGSQIISGSHRERMAFGASNFEVPRVAHETITESHI